AAERSPRVTDADTGIDSASHHSGSSARPTITRNGESASPKSSARTTRAAEVSADKSVAALASDAPEVGTFPPAQLQRMADAISTASVSANPRAGAVPTGVDMATPVRAMTIELHPTELGVVTVKLRLSGGDLSVALQASRPETARLLEHEKAALSKLLG